ncbi:hypothetical protein DFH07DRAFT_974754 [Mycena maculata]|uniref:Uncharacterized protein n=1 Tax=Mycena maculata TaxID=230809 RepID=A0AAD7H6V4_9AGAR|nr:hypothetical protein DFH07DRAFT_974754 [Mycena maculata]
MDSQAAAAAPYESASMAGTEYYSANAPAGPGPADDSRSSVSDVASQPGSRTARYTLHADEHGSPYLTDAAGNRLEVSRAEGPTAMSRASSIQSDGGDGGDNGPVHHSTLFSTEPSTETILSESVLAEGATGDANSPQLPELELDIDPDTLNATQIRQLNAIRGYLGASNARLAATTAIVAEQQAATEDMQDTINATRNEVVSRIDSLKNEISSQRCYIHATSSVFSSTFR